MKLRLLKVSAVGLFMIAFALAFVNGSRAQQTPQADATVDKTRKNIKVLKGLPESQLINVMNFISNSLGVSCAHCHVREGQDWKFEKDDKPTKETARSMMLMQFAINKNYKDIVDAGVTCVTCHRGQTEPRRIATLPAAPFPPTAGPGGAKPAEQPPTVDQVLDKYVQAIGGKAAFEKLTTRAIKGVQIVQNNIEIPLETYQAAPNKVVSILTTARQGIMTSGYNGTVGWAKNAQGQRELSGVQLDAMKRAADFFGDLKMKELPFLRFGGKDKIGERDVYFLVSTPSPNRTERLYFDVQTGLLVRIAGFTQTMLAEIPDQMDFEDYKEVDGVKLPFTIRQSGIDYRSDWTRKYSEIKHNVPVDESKFNPPSGQ